MPDKFLIFEYTAVALSAIAFAQSTDFGRKTRIVFKHSMVIESDTVSSLVVSVPFAQVISMISNLATTSNYKKEAK